MSLITHTEAGLAILIDAKLTEIDRGHIGLFILIASGKPDCWCLMFERGGDWMVFGDEMRHNLDELDGWMPDAVREATAAARASGLGIGDQLAEDMAWFDAWAIDAETTLALT